MRDLSRSKHVCKIQTFKYFATNFFSQEQEIIFFFAKLMPTKSVLSPVILSSQLDNLTVSSFLSRAQWFREPLGGTGHPGLRRPSNWPHLLAYLEC